ncbi:MAG TPA: hypothetical protein PKA00_19925 [Saprospiraceae bacterium]|nr:hypothetical protein [Saprospiraceae bacterium]HMQ85189.1 hypothetical protein [Saprospiraceae bacterium]
MKRLWLNWTFNCATGELLGIGTAGAIAYGINTAIGEPVHIMTKLIVLFAMMMAGAIEGSLLGFFQWRVLKKIWPTMPSGTWIGYTIAIAVLGWFLGMLPSLFFIPSQVEASANAGVELDQPVLFAVLSIGSGLLLGALFGLFQWIPLRKYSPKAAYWILANALGWGLGLGWIYLVASLPQEGSPLSVLISLGIAGGLLAGLSVGAITGWFLIRKIIPVAGG